MIICLIALFPAESFIEVSDAEEASETESLVKAEEAADKAPQTRTRRREERKSPVLRAQVRVKKSTSQSMKLLLRASGITSTRYVSH